MSSRRTTRTDLSNRSIESEGAAATDRRGSRSHTSLLLQDEDVPVDERRRNLRLENVQRDPLWSSVHILY